MGLGDAKRYSRGDARTVRTEDDSIPPITTVASGGCGCTSTSEPGAIAMSTKPSEATIAVINSGSDSIGAPTKLIN